MIGTRLGPWTVEAPIGRGGMGSVWRARDASAEPVALKVLDADLALDTTVVARFEQEAQLLASLRHPNVVAARGTLGTEGGRAFYAMELVPGRNLALVLKERGRFAPIEAVAATLEVLAALEAAHGQGIVHRDLKPANVLLSSAGKVKVVDFGLARVLDATRLTRSGHALGTPAYMSPEQAEAKPTDVRTDLYSTGVLLFELLTGKPPFDAESPLALLKLHVEAPVPPLGVAVPPGLEGVVRTALAKSPGARFESAQAFASALRAVVPEAKSECLATLAGSNETAELVPPPRAIAETAALAPAAAVAPTVETPRPARRARWVAVVSVLLTGALVPVVSKIIAGPPPERKRTVRVLLRAGGDPVEGELVKIDGASVRVRGQDGVERLIPLDVVEKLVHDPR